MSALENHQPRKKPVPISVEEFDRRAEEGEDLDEYFDWENAVVVEPGELSPGQLESLLAVFSKLSSSDQSLLIQRMLDAVAALGTDSYLNVPIFSAQYFRLKQMASQSQTTGEALVQSWIAQHLAEQKTAA